VIFIGIDARGRLESPLKIKRVFRDRLVRSKDVSFVNKDFRPAL
jgi:hypothetical protein